jgi:putative spermidine/putrescine transport system ATP-binding protein
MTHLNMSGEHQAYVSFRDVQKTYDGEALVIKDLTLDVCRGEFLTLLGPSGSGKTSCLMLLAGFETPSWGEITLDGVLLNRLPPHKRNIGIVFQQYALFPHLTVNDNLAYPLRVRRLSREEIATRVERALAMVRLSKCGSRLPSQLSGGQQQRVALARALVFDPKLVLMDEPLGALDRSLRDEMQDEIRRIHHQLGVTIIYVTHDQNEALTMSTRVAVLNNGVIQQIAQPSVLYEEPENAFVARFVGESNQLLGRVLGFENELCFVEVRDGVRLRARRVKVGAVGERTTLSVRPERILIDPPASAEFDCFTARIVEVVYGGDHFRVLASLWDSNKFLLTVANSESGRKLVAGELVRIGWRPEDCRALDA